MTSLTVEYVMRKWEKLQKAEAPSGLVRQVIDFFTAHIDDLAPYSIVRQYVTKYMTYDGYDSDVPQDVREVTNSYTQSYDIPLGLARTHLDFFTLDYHDLGALSTPAYTRKDWMKERTFEYITTRVVIDHHALSHHDYQETYDQIVPVLAALRDSLKPLYNTIKKVESKCTKESVVKSNKTLSRCYRLCSEAWDLIHNDAPLYHYPNVQIDTKAWTINI